MSKRILSCFAILLLTGFVCAAAHADEVGKFTRIEGKVDVLRAGQDVSLPVIEGEAVMSGDVVRTKSASKAEIKFNDSTFLKLAEDTRVEIKEYAIDQMGFRKNAIVNVLRGQIRAIVSSTTGAATNFYVNTPNTSGSVKGTDLFVSYQKSSTAVLVKEGEFTISNSQIPDNIIAVTKGFTTIIPPDGAPHAPRQYLDVERNQREAQTNIAPKPLFGQDSEYKGIVSSVSGEVMMRKDAAANWQRLILNDMVKEGYEIETKETGSAEIRLDNGNIINIKPNSKITLRELTRDANAGTYNDLIEIERGKLRAKVEKLKGDSSFKVKTPTAVAAVRGTIMYLDILPGMTKAYFENGTGALTSLISNITKDIAPGYSSSADGQGNVGDPVEDDGSSWNEGWDTGKTYGYSQGSGDDTDLGGDDGDGGPNQPPDGGGGDNGGIYIPPGINQGGGGNPSIALNGQVSGAFGYVDGEFHTDSETSVDGVLAANIPGTQFSGQPGVTFNGTYQNASYSLWGSDITGTTSDGGAFIGKMGGSMNSWEGSLATLYIDGAGNAGAMLGYLEGTNDEELGTMTGIGSLIIFPQTTTTVLPSELTGLDSEALTSDSGWGNINAYLMLDNEEGEVYFDGYFGRTFVHLNDENWGV